ncbi:UNVERIFIED_CONTAM: hypothetical protein Slati_1995800, partial [Sesamum latifolium]
NSHSNSQALSLLGRDLREAHLQVLLGGSGYRSNSATSSAAATDNFLSSLVLNFSSEADEISKSVMSSFRGKLLKECGIRTYMEIKFSLCLESRGAGRKNETSSWKDCVQRSAHFNSSS